MELNSRAFLLKLITGKTYRNLYIGNQKVT